MAEMLTSESIVSVGTKHTYNVVYYTYTWTELVLWACRRKLTIQLTCISICNLNDFATRKISERSD